MRLKRSIEVFPASDGALYLLRLGAGDDLVLPSPRAQDRALIELLRAGFCCEDELVAALRARGLSGEDVGRSLTTLLEAGLLEQAPAQALLRGTDAERYDRQLIYLADVAPAGSSAQELQVRLGRARVLLVGCGALGSWAACGLAGAGVGSLVLVDDDRIELSNLNRQLLFTEAQLGRPKVAAAAESLRSHNSKLEVRTVNLRIRCAEDLSELLEGVDVVIATADWPPHELPRWVNRACLAAAVPFITAGQFPPRLRIGPLVVPGESGCLECLETAARRSHPLYDELADFRALGMTPDAAIAPTSGAIGSLLAMEAMQLLVGLRPTTVGRAVMLDLASLEVEHEPVSRRADCPACARLDPLAFVSPD